jgi:hypothetical protein
VIRVFNCAAYKVPRVRIDSASHEHGVEAVKQERVVLCISVIEEHASDSLWPWGQGEAPLRHSDVCVSAVGWGGGWREKRAQHLKLQKRVH